jgi:hypothetical protein
LLTEHDLNPNGRPERYLFFRGESKPRKTIATSAYARWAFSRTGPCKNGCTAEELKKEFTTDVAAMPMYQASNRLFHSADRTWRLTIMFDPFISFSSSPLIAENFAGASSPGVVMILSVPKDQVVKTSDNCKIGNFDPSKIYDLYRCFGAAGSVEGEYDAYLSLPKEYIYSVHAF